MLCTCRPKRPSKLVSTCLDTSTGRCWTTLSGPTVSPIPLVWSMSTSHLMQGQGPQRTPWLGLQTTLHERGNCQPMPLAAILCCTTNLFSMLSVVFVMSVDEDVCLVTKHDLIMPRGVRQRHPCVRKLWFLSYKII